MRMAWSATKKKTEAMATITNTIAVVMAVSRRLGQVTFCPSARTSCMNLNGLIFAMVFLPLALVRGSIDWETGFVLPNRE